MTNRLGPLQLWIPNDTSIDKEEDNESVYQYYSEEPSSREYQGDEEEEEESLQQHLSDQSTVGIHSSSSYSNLDSSSEYEEEEDVDEEEDKDKVPREISALQLKSLRKEASRFAGPLIQLSSVEILQNNWTTRALINYTETEEVIYDIEVNSSAENRSIESEGSFVDSDDSDREYINSLHAATPSSQRICEQSDYEDTDPEAWRTARAFLFS